MIRPPRSSPFFPSTTLSRPPAAPGVDEVRARVGRELAGTVIRLGGLESDDVRELGRWALPSYDDEQWDRLARDRKSTRLNSSHLVISYAVFCLKKKN